MLRRHRYVEEEVLLSMTQRPASAANAAVFSARIMDGVVGKRFGAACKGGGDRLPPLPQPGPPWVPSGAPFPLLPLPLLRSPLCWPNLCGNGPPHPTARASALASALAPGVPVPPVPPVLPVDQTHFWTTPVAEAAKSAPGLNCKQTTPPPSCRFGSPSPGNGPAGGRKHAFGAQVGAFGATPVSIQRCRGTPHARQWSRDLSTHEAFVVGPARIPPARCTYQVQRAVADTHRTARRHLYARRRRWWLWGGGGGGG